MLPEIQQMITKNSPCASTILNIWFIQQVLINPFYLPGVLPRFDIIPPLEESRVCFWLVYGCLCKVFSALWFVKSHCDTESQFIPDFLE